MATSNITNRILDPSGTAIASVTINARLKPGPGFQSDTFEEIAGLETTTTDANGDWTLTLERNSGITPANSYWEIEEKIPEANGGPRVWAVQVGASNQTLLAALISAPVAAAANTYLTQASADARYQALDSFSGSIVAVGTNTASGSSTSGARADHKHNLSSDVVGAGLALTAGVLSANVSGGDVFLSTTNTVVVVKDGYRIPAAQTATPTLVTPGANDLWVRDGKQFVFSQNVWVQTTPEVAFVTATATITAATYNALTPAGPSVTLNTGRSVRVKVGGYLRIQTIHHQLFLSIAVTGASSITATDEWAVLYQAYATAGCNGKFSSTGYITGLTPGVNTFTVQGRVNTATGNAWARTISVESLPE